MLKKIIAFLTRTQPGHEAIPSMKTVLRDERMDTQRDMALAKGQKEREGAEWREKQKEKEQETPEESKISEV
ncbi:MAG: hypothetical protein AAB561_00770 [Patescibacteria group bacterium]